MSHVIAYSGQNDDTMKLISQRNQHTLVCLDSGESFRQKLYPAYTPACMELNITRRHPNMEFIRVPGLEAEDIRAIYLIKHKVSEPSFNARTLTRKILGGNFMRNIPQLMDPVSVDSIMQMVEGDTPFQSVLKFLKENTDIEPAMIDLNYRLVSRELIIYMDHFDGLNELYNRL